VRKEVDALVHHAFKPELLNRIDTIVFFNRLSEEDVQKIAHIQLDELKKRLAGNGITLTITNTAAKELAKESYTPEYGARPLKREIQRSVGVPIAQFLLKNPEQKNIKLDLKAGKVTII